MDHCPVLCSSHPLVKEFKEIISGKEDNSQEEINGEMEGDEELAMGQVQRSLTCPITQKLLEDPVKNRSCGHIYSRQGKSLTELSCKQIHCSCN